MSAVATPTRAKAPAKASAPRRSTAPTNPMVEIDQLLRPIATHISALIRPMVDSWPWQGDFPGRKDLQEADGVLMDLSRSWEEWVDGDKTRPLTGRMLEDLELNLYEALAHIERANDFDPGQRRLLFLLVREAVAQNDALGRAFGQACLEQRYEPLRTLAVGAGGKPLTRDTFEVNPSTPFLKAGKSAANLALWCTHDIETLSDEVTLLGDDADYEGQTSIGAKLRCFGARINSLNSVVMSYLSGDDNLSIGEVNTAYYGGAKQFKAQETNHA